jgi:hypothetical protein
MKSLINELSHVEGAKDDDKAGWETDSNNSEYLLDYGWLQTFLLQYVIKEAAGGAGPAYRAKWDQIIRACDEHGTWPNNAHPYLGTE